jgi:hypothetical protein
LVEDREISTAPSVQYEDRLGQQRAAPIQSPVEYLSFPYLPSHPPGHPVAALSLALATYRGGAFPLS